MAAYQHVRGAPVRYGRRSRTVHDMDLETNGGPDGRSASTEPKANDAYERLLSGEIVSWHQIMRDNPMLGTITVAQLVNAGVVRVTPDFDPITGTIDFRLCKQKQ